MEDRRMTASIAAGVSRSRVFWSARFGGCDNSALFGALSGTAFFLRAISASCQSAQDTLPNGKKQSQSIVLQQPSFLESVFFFVLSWLELGQRLFRSIPGRQPNEMPSHRGF
jgi:hypothetical protein